MTVHEEILINSGSDKVWAAVKDFANVQKWNPYVESVSLLTDESENKGATRVCHLYDGSKLKERVMDLDSEERIVTINILEGIKGPIVSPPEIKLTVLDKDDKTLVKMDFDVQLRFGFIGKIIKKLVVEPQIKNNVENLLKGLKSHIVSGSYIGKRGELLTLDAAKNEWGKAAESLEMVN